MSGLKPCPFCGGEARRVNFDNVWDSDNPSEGTFTIEEIGGSAIECARCQVSTPVHYGRKENLLDSWNRRVTNPLSEALKAIIERSYKRDSRRADYMRKIAEEALEEIE